MITAGDRRWVGRPLVCRLPPAWVCYTSACGLLIAAFFVLPLPDLALNVIFTGLSGGSAVALAAGIYIMRPSAWGSWALLTASQAVYAVADTSYYVMEDRYGEVPYPGPPDALYLSVYPLLAAGLVTLVRRRTPGWHMPTLIDATIVGTAATLLWWVYILHPYATSVHGTLFEQSVSTAYPALDVLVLVVGLRLMLGSGNRTPSFYLIMVSLVLMLTADVFFAVRNIEGTWQDYSWVDGLWIASYTLLGAAGLHPSMRRLGDRSTVTTPHGTPRRMVVLTSASLAAPAVLLIEHHRGRDADIPTIGVACALMFVLVLWRMSGLLAVQRQEAITDALTGLYTRRFFEENLRVEIERSRRSGTELGLVLIDVDHFKSVNDTYGHPGGDRVLVELARRVRVSCRPGDIVARIGGEEFALLMPAVNGSDAATALAERIRCAVSAMPVVIAEGSTASVTVSAGTANMPMNGTTTIDLVRAADEALYAAKRAGRDRVVVAGARRGVPDPGHGTRP